MRCRTLRDFPFSRDGIAVERAEKGCLIDLPDEIFPDLETAGYVEKAAAAAPENAALAVAPSNKALEPAPEPKARRRKAPDDQATSA